MKELTRAEAAAVKRTAANVKSFRLKKAKLETQIAKLTEDLEIVCKSIDLFEAPIIEVTGGFTSEQVLNGEMDIALSQLKVEEEPVVESTNEPALVESAENEAGSVTGSNWEASDAAPFPLFGSAPTEGPLPFEEA